MSLNEQLQLAMEHQVAHRFMAAEQIYQAILNQDAEYARAAMRLHLQDSREYLQQARQELRP